MNITKIDYKDMTDGDLCIRFREENDKAALAVLLERHVGFCYSEALKRHKYGPSVEDLVDEGKRGLYEAALRFDPDKGVVFLSYAGQFVKNYMRHMVREDGTKKRKKERSWEPKWIDQVAPHSEFFKRTIPVEERVLRKMQTRHLRACFLQLTDREQEILLEKFFNPPYLWAMRYPGIEIDNRELAKRFNTPPKLLRKNLKHAYKTLRDGLEPKASASRYHSRKPRIRREKGAYIHEDFWIVRE